MNVEQYKKLKLRMIELSSLLRAAEEVTRRSSDTILQDDKSCMIHGEMKIMKTNSHRTWNI